MLALAAGGVYLIHESEQGRTYSGMDGLPLLLGAYLGGKLPDLLEPASNPRHREAFHSAALGTVLGSCHSWVRAESEKQPEASFERMLLHILHGVVIGYLSHLGGDLLTPDGLPLLGRQIRFSLHGDSGW